MSRGTFHGQYTTLTEVGVDLTRLAGCHPTVALGTIRNHEGGSAAQSSYCYKFAKEHGFKVITIESLVIYRREYEI